jgi:hypothetical protein
MCILCGDDAEKGKEIYRRRAALLRDLAMKLDGMADGTVKPHTKDMDKVDLLATNVIRFLVADFV